MKAVKDIKDLDLKVLRFEKMLIYLRRLPRAKKELIFESKSNEKERWSDSKFKTLLLSCYVLNSAFDNIIMIALSNQMLNNSKFDTITI